MRGTSRVKVGDLLLRARGPVDFVDETLEPNHARIRSLVGEHDVDPGMIARATIVRANDGAPLSPLRTMSGNRSHENGLIPSPKSGRSLDYEGENQGNMIVKAQTLHDVVAIGSENVGVEYVDGGVARRYTSDLELVLESGPAQVVEMKRDRGDLTDPDYCRMMAIVSEVFRCCAIPFSIMLAEEVFHSRVHRAQACEFASRARVPFGPEDALALRRLAEATNGRSTLGVLCRALRGSDRWSGMAMVQAMTVARLVEVDLVQRIHGETPVILHPRNIRS